MQACNQRSDTPIYDLLMSVKSVAGTRRWGIFSSARLYAALHMGD
jgi:hypothetical protein